MHGPDIAPTVIEANQAGGRESVVSTHIETQKIHAVLGSVGIAHALAELPQARRAHQSFIAGKQEREHALSGSKLQRAIARGGEVHKWLLHQLAWNFGQK